ncbi:MAG: hypothetical protein HC838_00620 [Spirulinaceae cyanobacterium RM2_2_10]|nr:hypothetical protein [Spirulinaceae cyanobacterium RM2_2_10]
MNTLYNSEHDRVFKYAQDLPWDVLFLVLGESEQFEIANRLTHIYINLDASNKNTVVWALGKTTDKSGIEPLLEIINEHGSEFDEQSAFQASISLNNCLERFSDSPSDIDEETKKLFRREPILSFLQRVGHGDLIERVG